MYDYRLLVMLKGQPTQMETIAMAQANVCILISYNILLLKLLLCKDTVWHVHVMWKGSLSKIRIKTHTKKVAH